MNAPAKALSILLFPTRYNIYNTLKDSKKRMYASQIAEKIGVERKLVSFHLSSLERYGFLTSVFDVQNDPPEKGPPKAVRYYKLTGKAEKLLRELTEEIKL